MSFDEHRCSYLNELDKDILMFLLLAMIAGHSKSFKLNCNNELGTPS